MIRKISRMLAYRRLLRSGHPNLKVLRVTKQTHLHQAKRLHAEVYLENGYIEPGHIDANGTISVEHDPYQSHATYFVVVEMNGSEEQIVATARQIHPKGKKGHASFPTMEKLKLENNVRKAIESLDPMQCVEISALAKRKGYSSFASFLIYRALWQHSVRAQHQLWLMACDAIYYNRLKFLFRDALMQIGEETFYMGSRVIPAALEVDRSLDIMISNSRSLNPAQRLLHREYIRFFLEGLPTKYLKPHHLRALNYSRGDEVLRDAVDEA